MGEGHRISTILTVGMLKEGADWVQASRCLDLIPGGSDQERNQKFGLLVRDHTGKHRVHYFSFLPTLPGFGEDRQREACSRLFAHFHGSLILHNALNPIRVVPGRRTDGGAREGGRRDRPVDPLGCFDAQAAAGLLREATERILRHVAEDRELDWMTAKDVLIEALTDRGAHEVVGEENLVALATQIVLL